MVRVIRIRPKLARKVRLRKLFDMYPHLIIGPAIKYIRPEGSLPWLYYKFSKDYIDTLLHPRFPHEAYLEWKDDNILADFCSRAVNSYDCDGCWEEERCPVYKFISKVKGWAENKPVSIIVKFMGQRHIRFCKRLQPGAYSHEGWAKILGTALKEEN